MPSTFAELYASRNSITRREMREIRHMYNVWAKEIKEDSKKYSINQSDPNSLRYAREQAELYYKLRQGSMEITAQIERNTKRAVEDIADVVVRTNKQWLKSLGISDSDIDRKFSGAKQYVVSNIISGRLYGGSSLSQKIWMIDQGQCKDIQSIIARGVAVGDSIFTIAKELEKYVRPSASLPIFTSIYKDKYGIDKKFHIKYKKIDYNALRLVRTSIQHSYQQMLLELTKDNPLVEGFIWHASGPRPCEICLDRDGNFYTHENLPLDHPNGMCDMEVVYVTNSDPSLGDLVGTELIQEVQDWVTESRMRFW